VRAARLLSHGSLTEGGGMVRTNREQREASISCTNERLTRLMKERGVTLPALAASVRIQQGTLENFRGGHRNLPSDVLAAMAEQLGTSTDYLMDRSDDPRPLAEIHEETRLRLEARRNGH
jgi:transcriptional regulator with XRE-family HTH domain